MTYKLSVKLKNAGFPQTWPKPDFLELHDALEIQKIMDKYKKEDEPYQPTLSELIDACENGFESLTKNVITYPDGSPTGCDDRIWLAKMYGYEICGEGQTPEEAVSELWLALNNKK